MVEILSFDKIWILLVSKSDQIEPEYKTIYNFSKNLRVTVNSKESSRQVTTTTFFFQMRILLLMRVKILNISRLAQDSYIPKNNAVKLGTMANENVRFNHYYCARCGLRSNFTVGFSNFSLLIAIIHTKNRKTIAIFAPLESREKCWARITPATC
jgi:hypothetical protein